MTWEGRQETGPEAAALDKVGLDQGVGREGENSGVQDVFWRTVPQNLLGDGM